MAKQAKVKKQPEARNLTSQKNRQVTSSSAVPKRQQSRVRRVFTVVICVIVALGLMLPVAGLGFASCSLGCGNAGNNPNNSSTP